MFTPRQLRESYLWENVSARLHPDVNPDEVFARLLRAINLLKEDFECLERDLGVAFRWTGTTEQATYWSILHSGRKPPSTGIRGYYVGN